MKPCPGCARELADKAVACNSCGYEFPVRSGKTHDPERWRCQHVEPMGERCKEQGNVSLMGGPFLCWPHAMPSWKTWARGPIPDSFHQVKATLAAKLKPFDFEAEAERAAIQNEP